MQEKLVEHWLTNANELSYQIPFCEVLTAKGYNVIHVSSHGRAEHGKDIVARSRHGRLFAFQLKGGDIALPNWRDIRGEVEELVQLPVRLPGVSENETHTPLLVTNGEIRGDAVESIVRYRNQWEQNGYPLLRVVSRRTLLRVFLDAQGHFLPTALGGFRRFVELFVGDFTDRLPREKFAQLLEEMVAPIHPKPTPLRTTRSLAGMAVVAGYIAEQYERASNYVSAAEAWTITASAVLHCAERDNLSLEVYEPVLRLLGIALDRDLDAFVVDALGRDHLMEHAVGIADPFVYGARVSLTLGWLAASAHRRLLIGQPLPDAVQFRHLLSREIVGLRIAGEVDWPAMMLLAIYVERFLNSRDAESILELWARLLLSQSGKDRQGIPSPYWLHERVIANANGMVAPNEEEHFAGQTYTLLSSLDMLVRRLRRQLVARIWPASSRLIWCDFLPDALSDYFRWSAETGTLTNTITPQTAHWGEWRKASSLLANQQVPLGLRRHPEWLAPFLMTYPHRANRALSAFADSVLGRRVRMTGAITSTA